MNRKNKILNYAVIGKNWGIKINNILNSFRRKSFIIDLDYKNMELTEYLKNLKNIIYKNKIDIIWLAIPPKSQYEISKFILQSNTNLILEKPVIFNHSQKKILNELLIKNKLFLSVNFEYIFLEELKNFNYDLNFDEIKFVFNHKNFQKTLPPDLDLGIHMMAIKKLYFNNVKNYKLENAFNSIDERKIIFKFRNEIVYKIDFTNSNQKIIQLFITYFETKVMKNIENKLNLNFSTEVYNELIKNRNVKI